MSLCPTLITGGTVALGKVQFLDCQSGKCQEKHPRPVSHSFFLPPSPGQTPIPFNTHSVEGAFIHRWGDGKEGGWRWEPQHQETWSPRGFSKLFQPRGSTSFRCSRLSFTAGGPHGSGGCGPLQKGAGTPGPWGRAHWLVYHPSSISPMIVHPWEPSLSRLQGCASSPGHQGLRGTESTFSFHTLYL